MKIVAEDANIELQRLDTGGDQYAHAYLLSCRHSGESVLIDAPGKAPLILEQIEGKTIKYILMTHNHSDHIGALTQLKSRLKVPVAGHPLDASRYPVPLDIELNDGDTVTCGKLKIKVLFTPGHTRGSLSFLTGKYLISGDTLFPGGPGHTTAPANFKQIIKTLTEKIFVLPDETQVYPGHGDPAVLGEEKAEYALFSTRNHSPELCGDVLWKSS